MFSSHSSNHSQTEIRDRKPVPNSITSYTHTKKVFLEGNQFRDEFQATVEKPKDDLQTSRVMTSN